MLADGKDSDVNAVPVTNRIHGSNLYPLMAVTARLQALALLHRQQPLVEIVENACKTLTNGLKLLGGCRSRDSRAAAAHVN